METRTDRSSAAGRVLFLAYLTLVVSAAWFHPRPDWDLAGYAGCALEWSVEDAERLQRETFADLEASLTPSEMADLTGRNAYRRTMASDAESFRQQLPFYRARAVHVGALAALHRLGLSFLQAAAAISALSTLVLGLISFRWISLHIGGLAGALSAIGVLVAADALGTARSMTPDALSAALFVGALYTLVEGRRPRAALFLALTSLLARPDNLLPALAVLIALWRAGRGAWAMTTPRFALCSGLLIAVTAGAAALADAHGWWVVFSHSFGGWIERPELSVPAFSWSAYAATVAGALGQLHSLPVAILGLGCGAAWVAGRRTWLERPLFALCLAVAVSVLVRFALFPSLSPRLLTGSLAVVGVMALAAVGEAPSDEQ